MLLCVSDLEKLVSLKLACKKSVSQYNIIFIFIYIYIYRQFIDIK